MTTRPPLQPLGFGEILDAGFRLWRQNLGIFVGVAAVLGVPILLINSYITWDNVIAVQGGFLYVNDPDLVNNLNLIMIVVGVVATLVTNGALMLVAVRRYQGINLKIGEAFRTVLKRFFPFLGLMILMGLGIGAGMIALLIPGIFLMVAWQLAFPVFWQEGVGPVESLRRSYTLMKGRWWSLFGMMVVLFIIVFVFSLLSGAVMAKTWIGDGQMLTYTLLTAVGSAVINILLAPLFPAVVTAFYFDTRVRREGFDVEFEAGRLDEADPGIS